MGQIQKFTKEQFKGFLLAYSSHVDFKFSQEEKDLIFKCVPNNSEHIMNSFHDYNESERTMLIVEGVVEHLKTEQDVNEFNEALQHQFMADGKYCRFEKCFFEYFNDLSRVNIQ